MVLAWSGGKDSLLALQSLREDPSVSLVALATTFSGSERRISAHGVCESLAEAQAAALGIPMIKIWLPEPSDNETYRKRFAEALEPVRAGGLDTVAFGDLFLNDVRAFRERQMAAIGLVASFPLWGGNTRVLAARFTARGHRAIVVAVDGEQLAADFLGREFDADFLAAIPPGVDPCGENGEFHTFVYAGPLLKNTVHFLRGARRVDDNRFHYLDLVPVDDRGLV